MNALARRLRSALLPRPDDDELVAGAPRVPMREIAGRFWPDARPYRRWIPLLLVLIALGAAFETIEIWLFKLVVDDVLTTGDLGPLAWIAGAYVGLTLLAGLVSFADEYLSTWLGEHFLMRMRLRVFSHLHGLSLDLLDRRRLGDLISRLTGDVQAIETFVLSGVTDGLAALLRILFFTGALFVLDWQLALAALAIVPAFALIARGFARLIKQASREERRRAGSLSAVAEQSLANAALVQSLNRQEHEIGRFRRENEGMIDAELSATRIRGLYTPIVNLVELGGVLGVFVLGTIAVTQGRLSLGGLLVFAAYLTQLYAPVRELGSLANYLFRAQAGAERVIELLDERPRVTDRPDAQRLGAVHGEIELEGVGFRYPGADSDAVDEIDLRVGPGETLALVGPSGAGKSTLAKLMLRFYDPDRGQIRIDGQDLRSVTIESLRESVSILLQDALILHGTVRQNLAFAREGVSQEEIVAAARLAGAHEFISALPAGYETEVGERGRSLSGGQRQRLAIARALVADAPVLILDEPSTGLDAEAKAALIEPLRGLMHDRTTIVISHDLLTTRDADRIAVLDGGRVVESGRHFDLLELDGLYRRLWELHRGDRVAAEWIPS
jgi:ATP-binding cassette, subfamily B, bacterial